MPDKDGADAAHELRIRADILHRHLKRGEPRAIARLRRLPGWTRLPVERLRASANSVRRRDCLTLIARELGFADWNEAKRALDGRTDVASLGTLTWRTECAVYLNRWCRNYAEAKAMHDQTGGYLLGYRHQFLVVDRDYIESLGLDPDDRDWHALGFDWLCPDNPAARARLYAKLLATLPREA